MTKTEAKERIIKLRAEINHHRYLYHVLDKPEISDAALDSLKHELWKLEEQFPDLVTSDSPTQRVGGAPVEGFEKVNHLKPILSIEDAFSLAEVAEWQQRNEKILNNKISGFYGELKMDGLAIVLTYENGLLSRGVTRGNGTIGEDVTSNLRTIESIPLRLEPTALSLPKRLDVRGEVVITRSELARINKEQKKKGEAEFANPRNLAAGSIRQLDPKVAASRCMEFYAFEILTDLGQQTHAEVHELLLKLGFKTNNHCQELAGLKDIEDYVTYWAKKRQSLPYQTDGVVIVVNSIAQQKKLGSIGKADRWMLAFKFPAEQATTRVNDIVVQVGRTGALTPVALLAPVQLAGTTVSRATLHNEDEIKRLNIRVGDTVIVEKAGDIIPDVVKVLTNLRTGKEKVFHMPLTCPACGTRAERRPGEVAWYCPNKKCFAIRREQFYHFVSRAAFNIEGLGPKIINQLFDQGLIKDAADLFALTVGDLMPLERFAEKSAQNLVQAINSKKNITLARFINALGIRHVGEETAELLANHFVKLEHLLGAEQADFESIDGVGPIVAASVASFLSSTENKKYIGKLLQVGIKVGHSGRVAGKLSGKVFVVTGTFNNYSRESIKQSIKLAGGNVTESVSSKTDYVLVGESPGSKYERAITLGVKILNESEFKKLVEE